MIIRGLLISLCAVLILCAGCVSARPAKKPQKQEKAAAQSKGLILYDSNGNEIYGR